jgi:hypothetical protein
VTLALEDATGRILPRISALQCGTHSRWSDACTVTSPSGIVMCVLPDWPSTSVAACSVRLRVERRCEPTKQNRTTTQPHAVDLIGEPGLFAVGSGSAAKDDADSVS